MIGAAFPWFGVVGSVYAIRRAVQVPALLDPFVRTPNAYLTVGASLIVTWIVVGRVRPESRASITGLLGVTLLGAALLVTSVGPFRHGSDVLVWNAIAIALAILLTVGVWRLFRNHWSRLPTAWIGSAVVFAHVLDATTTAIGVEVFGTVERNPIAASIISLGDAIGLDGAGATLFLLVKIIAANLILSVAKGTVDVERERLAMLVVAGGVGLAPASHNLVLFLLTVP